MNKYSTPPRIISVLLVLVLLFSISAAAFAAPAEQGERKYKQHEYYLGIGDSITRGYGLEGYKYNKLCMHAIDGSYPQIVADAVGCDSEHRLMMNYPGQRTKDTARILGLEGDYTDVYSLNIDGRGINLSEPMKTDNVELFKEWIRKADLITIGLGIADVFYAPYHASGLEQAGMSAENIENCVKEALAGYADFCEYYPKLLQYIRENNEKNADIVLVGIYNTLENASITEDIILPVADLLSPISAMMNENLKLWAEEYGAVVANIQNVETPASRGEVLAIGDVDSKTSTHPTPEGLKYIARQVLDVLPGTDDPVVYRKTDIVIDLVDPGTIIGVSLDSRTINYYEFDGHVLYIPYYFATAKTLTVTAEKDGKVSVYLYQLSYGDDGYDAYRIVGTSDIAKTFSRIINLIVKLIQNFFSIFSK